MPLWLMAEWRYSSTILKLNIRWSWVVSFTPHPLYPREIAPGNHWRLGGPQSRPACCGEDKILPMLGIELRPSSLSLYRLSYPYSLFFFNHNIFLKLGYLTIGHYIPYSNKFALCCQRLYTIISLGCIILFVFRRDLFAAWSGSRSQPTPQSTTRCKTLR
jgi:hypothetical protein